MIERRMMSKWGAFVSLWKNIINLFNNKNKQEQTHTKADSLPTGHTFEQQIKHDLNKAIEAEENSTNPKFHRTTKEEDLAFNFSVRHFMKLNSLENDVYNTVNLVFSTYHIDERIEQCRKAIDAYENLKKYCVSKGKGGTTHFEDMWEHCHNSKNPDFRFIEKVENELFYLTENYETAKQKLANNLIKQENKKMVDAFKKRAESDVLKVIQYNSGIVQKDIYLHFDEIYKNTIRNTIKKLELSDKITRIKKGNSFEIYFKEGR